MAFDDATRGRLQRFVGDARTLLTEEFTRQLQQDYGLDPSTGDVADLDSLAHLDDRRLETARILREILAHYLAADMATGAAAGCSRPRPHCARAGLYHAQSARRASHDGGARHPDRVAWRKAISRRASSFISASPTAPWARPARPIASSCSAYSTLSLPTCRRCSTAISPQGRLFPREAALLAVLKEFDAPDLEPLWGEDETIGWIYQYFNSKEERQAMRKASPGAAQQPRACRAQPVLHPALCGGVPGRQHARPALVQLDRRATELAATAANICW